MAITLVNGSTNDAAAGSSLSLTLPAGMAQNDVVYVFLSRNANTAFTVTSSGWTSVGTLGNATAMRTEIWRKVMGASPDTTFTVSDTTNQRGAIAIALRGVDTGTPEDATATSATNTTGAPDSPSITTTRNGAWVISFGHNIVNDTTVTNPTGYSNQFGWGRNSSPAIGSFISTKSVATAGAENPAAWTNWSSGAWIAWSVAVRPSLNVAFAGTTSVTFGQTGALNGGATLAGTTPVTFGQTATFVAGAAPAVLAGTTAISFAATATFEAGAGETQFAGVAAIVFDATATLTAGMAGEAIFVGSTTIVFTASATFSAGTLQPEGPRGAWISDQRVERGRRRRWREQLKHEEELRLDLEDILAGRPPRSQIRIEVVPLPVPGSQPLLIPAPSPELLSLREEVAGLNAWAEAEAQADEEAGIISLLMSI